MASYWIVSLDLGYISTEPDLWRWSFCLCFTLWILDCLISVRWKLLETCFKTIIIRVTREIYFSAGMFPYVGIVTMFIFCQTNWPRKLWSKLKFTMRENKFRENFQTTVTNATSSFRKFIILISIVCYVLIQLFLPFSHFITRVRIF